MSDKKEKEDFRIDPEDMSQKQLRKALRIYMNKCREYESSKDEAIEKADADRDELVELQNETNGKMPEVEVLEDDLPEDIKSKKKKSKDADDEKDS